MSQNLPYLTAPGILKIDLHSRISIAYGYAHTVFSFSSRRAFPEERPSKVLCQVISFRNRTYAKSFETGKIFKS